MRINKIKIKKNSNILSKVQFYTWNSHTFKKLSNHNSVSAITLHVYKTTFPVIFKKIFMKYLFFWNATKK